jgi:hypothetical protein
MAVVVCGDFGDAAAVEAMIRRHLGDAFDEQQQAPPPPPPVVAPADWQHSEPR